MCCDPPPQCLPPRRENRKKKTDRYRCSSVFLFYRAKFFFFLNETMDYGGTPVLPWLCNSRHKFFTEGVISISQHALKKNGQNTKHDDQPASLICAKALYSPPPPLLLSRQGRHRLHSPIGPVPARGPEKNDFARFARVTWQQISPFKCATFRQKWTVMSTFPEASLPKAHGIYLFFVYYRRKR